jgi:hypothetical protein
VLAGAPAQPFGERRHIILQLGTRFHTDVFQTGALNFYLFSFYNISITQNYSYNNLK